MKKSPANYSEIVGKKFTSLYVINIFYSDKMWLAEVVCDCGNKKVVRAKNLLSGNTKSCGCVGIKKIIDRNTTHGLRDHPLYQTFYHMKSRCYDESNDSFQYYGGRGIIICQEWLEDFKSFYDWAINNAWEEGLEIDRKNPNGNYEPKNCRFVTQARNKRTRRCAVKVVYNERELLLLDLADEIGMNYKTIKTRYHRGWPIDKIVETPLRIWPSQISKT